MTALEVIGVKTPASHYQLEVFCEENILPFKYMYEVVFF